MSEESERDETLVAFQVRLPKWLVEHVEARMQRVGERSRNQWIVRAVSWAVSQPPRETSEKVRT